MNRALIILAPILLLAPSLSAQISTGRDLPPLIFDQMRYGTANWCGVDGTTNIVRPSDTPLHANAFDCQNPPKPNLFGVNDWCVDETCSTVPELSRFWMLYEFRESQHLAIDNLSTTNDAASLTVDTSWVTIRYPAGEYAGLEREPAFQIKTGHMAETGVWAAGVIFSALPEGRNSNLYGTAHPRIQQTFWTTDQGHAYVTGSGETTGIPASLIFDKPDDNIDSGAEPAVASWSEIDIAHNNWLGGGTSPPFYHDSAVFEDAQTFGGGLPGFQFAHKSPPWVGGLGADYSCAYSGPGTSGLEEKSASFCYDKIIELNAQGYASGLFIRNRGDAVRIEIRIYKGASSGQAETLIADTGWRSEAVTSQLMSGLFSLRIARSNNCSGPDTADCSSLTLAEDLYMKMDWYYYTPEHSRHADLIFGDVGYLSESGRSVGGRFNLLGSQDSYGMPTLFRYTNSENGGANVLPNAPGAPVIADLYQEDGKIVVVVDNYVEKYVLYNSFGASTRFGVQWEPWTQYSTDGTLDPYAGHRIEIPFDETYNVVRVRAYPLKPIYTDPADNGRYKRDLNVDDVSTDEILYLDTFKKTGSTSVGRIGPQVVPNPSNESVSASCPEATEAMTIVDMLGRKVLTVRGRISEQVTGLSSGIYVLSCRSVDTEARTTFTIVR